jgi:transposase-like protein
MPLPVPVLINGQHFPSMSEAARTLGVTRTSIWKAIEEGREAVGQDIGYHLRVRCYFKGRMYPSVKAAAEAHGITSAAVSKARAKMRAG